MTASDLVLVTYQYKVIALRKSDGEKIWETELIKRFFKPADAFIALVIDENAVYAHAINEMFCLDLMTGRILWQKELGKRSSLSVQAYPPSPLRLRILPPCPLKRHSSRPCKAGRAMAEPLRS